MSTNARPNPKPESGPPNPADALKRMMGPLMGPPNGSTMAPLLLGQSFAQEGLRFWARRMHAYAELAEAAARCQSPADYLDVQKAFFTQAQKDYTDEGAAVAELMSHPLQSNGKGH